MHYRPILRLSVHPSVRSFVRCQSCEYNILERNKPILTQTGASGPRGKGIKRSTLRVKRSRSHAAEIRNKMLSATYLKKCKTNFDQTWRVNAYYVTITRMQKGQKSRSTKVNRSRNWMCRSGISVILDFSYPCI